MAIRTEHPFKVEAWTPSQNIERTFAVCDHIDVARAAFDAAVEAYPDRWITLRHGMQVLRENGKPVKP